MNISNHESFHDFRFPDTDSIIPALFQAVISKDRRPREISLLRPEILPMKFADCIDSAKTEKTALHDIRPTSCLVLIIKGTYVKTAYCIRMLDVKV
jgi:hypothetical protein